MKLNYFKTKNILSFGNETHLNFNLFNIIAGPNNSGKTNFFRALKLVEKAFTHNYLETQDLSYEGKDDADFYIEIGIELNEKEAKAISKQIICDQIFTIEQGSFISIKNDQDWKTILKYYGKQILEKSFKNIVLIIRKDEIIDSKIKMLVQIGKESKIFLSAESTLSETDKLPRNTQSKLLGEFIFNDFHARHPFSQSRTDELFKDEQELSNTSPSLNDLLKNKLCPNTNTVISLSGEYFDNYLNVCGKEVIEDFAQLLSGIGIKKDNHLSVWEIIKYIYSTAFVRIKELRYSLNEENESESSSKFKNLNFKGIYLAKHLFSLASSQSPIDREHYSKIKKYFSELTDSEFDIAIREKEVTVTSELNLGAQITPQSSSFGGPEIVPIVFRNSDKKIIMNEAFIQIIKNNYPISIEQTASGLYEILLILTAIIGERGKIILLDEPELHLHPSMQKRILNLLVEYSNVEKNQIMLITHSPYLVSGENIENTWCFKRIYNGTKVHNISEVLSNLSKNEKGKFKSRLSIADVRSLLFSQGVILVEGLSDKLVIEQVDKYLSDKGKGANINEKEWVVLDIGGKTNLPSFIKLCQTLDVPHVAVLDEDALMYKDSKIEFANQEIKTSVVFFALQNDELIKNPKNKVLLCEASDEDYYLRSCFDGLRKLAADNHIFVFPSDLEGVIKSINNGKKRKILKALNQILGLISEEKLPKEFYCLSEFLQSEINRATKP